MTFLYKQIHYQRFGGLLDRQKHWYVARNREPELAETSLLQSLPSPTTDYQSSHCHTLNRLSVKLQRQITQPAGEFLWLLFLNGTRTDVQ